MEKSKKGGKSPLGEKIANLALKRGFAKPSDFANHYGINIGTFNDLIYGKTKIMPDSLIKVSEALGVEPWELLKPIEPANEAVASEKCGDEHEAADLALEKRRGSGRDRDHESESGKVPSEGFKNTHAIASEIAAEIITALKSEFGRSKIAEPQAPYGEPTLSRLARVMLAFEMAAPDKQEMVEAVLFSDADDLQKMVDQIIQALSAPTSETS